jgi:hypothetical protein
MQARQFLVVIVAVVIVAVGGGAVLLLANLRRRQRAKLAAAGGPSAGGAPSDDRWSVAKDDQQFGPITFDQLRSYLQDGLVTRSDLLKRAGSQAWMRAQDVQGLFPLPPPVRAASAIRRPMDVVLSAHDRVAAPPVSEAQALQRVTAEILRHPTDRDRDPGRSVKDRSAQPPPGAAARKRSNYFARHWRGELSLPVSYWINGILARIATLSIVAAINATTDFKDDFQPGIALAAEILIWTTTAAVMVWQLVGLWRSAANYRRALKIFWGTLAQVLVVLGAAEMVASFALVGAPQIRELYNIYRGDAEMGSYAFRVLRDGRELEFSGGITFGAAKDFQRFLDAMGVVQVVHLNSPGGRLQEAERIGRLLQDRKLSTYVVNECLSACTHIFLSGRERLISPEGRLGFHQPDGPGLTMEERRTMLADEEQRLRELGVSAGFARKAILAPPDNMWYPSVGELLSEHVATRVVNSADFALSGLNLSDITEEAIRDKVLFDPMFAKIREFDPNQYARIAQYVEEGLRSGVSATELSNSFRPLLGRIYLEMLPYASDDDLTTFIRVTIKNMSKIRNEGSPECYFYLNRDKANKAELAAMAKKYQAEIDEEGALGRQIITNFRGRTVRIPDEKAVSSTMQKLATAIGKVYGQRTAVIGEDDVAPGQYLLYCSVTVSLFSEALKLSQKEGIAFFRYVLRHPPNFH